MLGTIGVLFIALVFIATSVFKILREYEKPQGRASSS